MRWYGVLGLILIILVELNFYFKIQPFAQFYFPFVWVGYILVMDALVYKFSDRSLITRKPRKFLALFIISAIIWWTYEIINLRLQSWGYFNSQTNGTIFAFTWHRIHTTLAFSTVLPAFFETFDVLKALHKFDYIKLRHRYNLSKSLLYSMIVFGILCLVLPIARPDLFYPMIWASFFFLLDPINYMRGDPSLVEHLQCRNMKKPFQLASAGLMCGFFWEFWNYWALVKWKYNIPYVGFLKIFEMPVLGYLGYIPFALSLYSMYYFTRHYFKKALYSQV